MSALLAGNCTCIQLAGGGGALHQWRVTITDSLHVIMQFSDFICMVFVNDFLITFLFCIFKKYIYFTLMENQVYNLTPSIVDPGS